MNGRISRRWTLTAVGTTTAALATGLAMALPPGSPGGPLAASASPGLARFSDCDAVAAWYIKQALPKVTAWGIGRPTPIMYGAVELDIGRAAVAPAATPTSGAVGNGPTGTNVQETDVDEPDVAKTWGDYVVSVEGHTLLVTDVSGDTPEVVGRLELAKSWTYELMIVGDRAIVTGSAGAVYRGLISPTVRIAGPMIPYGMGGGRASVTTVDLSDPTSPSVVQRNVVEGTLQTSREHDGTIRIVLTSDPDPDLPFVYPHPGLTRAEAKAENQRIVEESTAQDWLPQRGVDRDGDGGTPLLDCADVAHPSQGSGLGTISVLTMDPAHPGRFTSTAISADGSLVYASADRLYVSTVDAGWSFWTEGDAADGPGTYKHPKTEVHAFAADGTTTSYVASGVVDGVPPDRWAFSEQDGLLRVATTLGPQWNPTENVVTVLKEDADQLVPVGEVGDIGPNEGIKAVRWFGDLAVVVTFRQVDPLYLLDLSDPSHPVVLDELKVPGFSEYLHPVGGPIIVGVGQTTNHRGWSTGSQLSSFDLSDLSRIDQVTFGSNTYSPVETDSRAFTYLPDQGLALVPVGSWRRGSAKVEVVHVAADGTLTVQSTISVPHWVDDVRALPLGSGRVAIVSGGHVQDIDDLS